MERKLDGWRFLFERTVEGDVKAIGGRNGRDHTGQAPDVENWLEVSLPPGTVLDGELVPLNRDDAVSSILAERGTRRLAFVAFDVVAVAAVSALEHSWRARRRILEVLVQSDWTGPVRLSECVDPDEDVLAGWLDAGGEGAVLKRVESIYRPGKRSRDWLKYKPQTTDEAIVSGFEMGKGQSNGHLVGALKIVMFNGAETTIAFTGTPEEAQGLIGRIVEVKHYGLFPSGKPRHPGFSKWRPDLEMAT
jgi:bifunctional non-homologous end joining protein LigD